jgi:transposase
VEADDQPELNSFAIGIRRDQPAVTAGLTLSHSSGRVEGNRQLLKRSNGRCMTAKLDLLLLVIFG